MVAVTPLRIAPIGRETLLPLELVNVNTNDSDTATLSREKEPVSSSWLDCPPPETTVSLKLGAAANCPPPDSLEAREKFADCPSIELTFPFTKLIPVPPTPDSPVPLNAEPPPPQPNNSASIGTTNNERRSLFIFSWFYLCKHETSIF